MDKKLKTIAVLLAFGCVLYGNAALAACRKMTQAEVQEWTQKGMSNPVTDLKFTVVFPAGTVEVSPDLGIGEPIVTGTSSPLAGDTAILICDWFGGVMNWNYTQPASRKPAGSNAIESGAKGIGVRLSYVRASSTASTMPYTSTFSAAEQPGTPYLPTLRAGMTMKVELVKTGEMDSESTISLGHLGEANGDGGGGSVVDTYVNSIVIKVLPSCSVDAPNQDIDFGRFGPGTVSATSGPNRPVRFRLSCSGPTAPQSVETTLSGTPDGIDARLIANRGTARNLAIQLKDDATGTVLQPDNAASKLYTNGGKKSFDYAMTATVLRVGSEAPTPGTISATSVLTMKLN